MAYTIKIKRGAQGNKEQMSTLGVGELGYITDKKELHIGTSGGNVRLCGSDLYKMISTINDAIADITARLDALENPSE